MKNKLQVTRSIKQSGRKRSKVESVGKAVNKKFRRDESDELSKEEIGNVTLEEEEEEEEVKEYVSEEPTVYDDLLKRLGSREPSVADALRRRQRDERGQSETEEDEDSAPESSNDSAEKDSSADGSDGESPRRDIVRNGAKQSGVRNGVELSEDAGTDDEYAPSDIDEDSNILDNDQSLSEASVSTFDNHLSYKLSSTEAESLLERKWSYTWKIPALNTSNCHWRGTEACSIKDLDVHSSYGLKPRLYKHWLEMYKASGGTEFDQSKQRSFFSICNSYCDILHHNKKPFYLKGMEEDSSIMEAYLMHCLNHIFRSRDLLAKNEKKIRQQESVEEKQIDDDAYLDRGFTRPKVLILLPLAGIARRVIKRLIHLTPSKHKANVENLERFYEEFGSGRTEDGDDEDDLENHKSKQSSKPSDFQALLGRDNTNDHFMIGVKFTNRGVMLFGDFYTSDIIVASPLGLITKIGEAEKLKDRDVDYLSSVEVLVIDHADVMLMQNWSHVNTVVEKLNRLPSKQHGTDIMRIRPWYLDEQARFYRQTIILSSHINPDINCLFNQHCLNYQGKVRLECKYRGVLPKILVQARQIYERLDIKSIEEADEARLKYFCEKVFPMIKDSVQDGVMIFTSSYFEFVRLRNYLKAQGASVCLFGEYIKQNDISGVRGQFFRGEKKIMLYTERAHFYYRYKIRGVKNLIFYSLPERKEFYPEIVNLLEESDSMNCKILFSRLDHLRLERIVGSTAAKRMVDSEKSVFVFAYAESSQTTLL